MNPIVFQIIFVQGGLADYTKNFLVTGVQSMNCPIPG